MRITLLQQWIYYKNIISEREKKYTESVVPKLPQFYYEVSPNGAITEWTITGASYHNRKYFGENKKPTNKDVEEIKTFAYSIYLTNLNIENITVCYERVDESSAKRKSGFKFTEMSKKIFDKEVAVKLSEETKEKCHQEELLLQNGHTRCDRCRRIVPDAEVVHEKMISIANFGSAGKMMKFCSNTCAAHEQMSLEG